jgi:hypothetical protein
MILALQGQEKDLEETLKILSNFELEIEQKPLKGLVRVLDRHLCSYWIVVHRLLHHSSKIL